MTRFFLDLPGHIARTALAAAFGVVLIGSAAHAQDAPAKPDQKPPDSESQKHQKEMEKGKDHEAARDAAGRAKKPAQAPNATESQKHQKEMEKGKDHEAARDAAGRAKEPAQAPNKVISKEKIKK